MDTKFNIRVVDKNMVKPVEKTGLTWNEAEKQATKWRAEFKKFTSITIFDSQWRPILVWRKP